MSSFALSSRVFRPSLKAVARLHDLRRVNRGAGGGQRSACTNKELQTRGSKKTLALFEALGLEGVEIVEIRCLDECGMGPKRANQRGRRADNQRRQDGR